MDDAQIEMMETEYLWGFNRGYLIAEHLPDLATDLREIKSDAPKLVGLRDGIDEFLKEKDKSLLPDWLKDNPFKPDHASPSKDLDIDMDKE
ncbi:MAG: hypothetical protein JSS82_09870 [Bacteroidetes bacterium]|nr:hypothetical protein [Bacteroidota bacterium]